MNGEDIFYSSLNHYEDILREKTNPAYIKTKHIPVSFNTNDSLQNLWNIHNKSRGNNPNFDTKPEK